MSSARCACQFGYLQSSTCRVSFSLLSYPCVELSLVSSVSLSCLSSSSPPFFLVLPVLLQTNVTEVREHTHVRVFSLVQQWRNYARRNANGPGVGHSNITIERRPTQKRVLKTGRVLGSGKGTTGHSKVTGASVRRPNTTELATTIKGHHKVRDPVRARDFRYAPSHLVRERFALLIPPRSATVQDMVVWCIHNPLVAVLLKAMSELRILACKAFSLLACH